MDEQERRLEMSKQNQDYNKGNNDGRRVLPCPFCGGPAKVHKQLDGSRKIRGYYVCCNTKGCPVYSSTRVKKEKGVIVDEWNTRKGVDVL